MAALGRGDLWWAYGQLEALRQSCVNLVRIEHGVEAQEEAHEKLGKAVPVSELTALRMTFCAMDATPSSGPRSRSSASSGGTPRA